MKLRDDVRIAGDRTVGEWFALRPRLLDSNDAEAWQLAFDGFFKKRLDSRYFEPIRALQNLDEKKGEGFSIVAIQCSLIEFLGSTMLGETYRYGSEDDGSGIVAPVLAWLGFRAKASTIPYYSDSKRMFVWFLRNAPPFKDIFTKRLAKDFYAGVRCGLMHEARTKRGWVIRWRPTRGASIDQMTKTLWRDDFQRALEEFVDWYRGALFSTPSYQQAFIRKFDGLCED